jgi:hypothetical protein
MSPGYLYANAQGMAFDSAGNLYVANLYHGTVMKVDKHGNGSVFATNLYSPESITIKRDSTTTFIPRLTIRQVGTNAVLSWSTAATGYNVKTTTSLASPVWVTLPGIVVTNGGSLMLTNGISGPVRFYRLSNP